MTSKQRPPLQVGHFTGQAATSSERSSVAADARSLLNRSLPPTISDDRFAYGWAPDENYLAATAYSEGRLVGLAGTTVSWSAPARPIDVDLLVDANEVADPTEVAVDLLDTLHAALTQQGLRPEEQRVWTRPALDWHHVLADRGGLTPSRHLHQLRCPLPVEAPTLTTHAFRPGTDDDDVVAVNNRAFASHPDQGNQEPDWLRRAATAEWFQPEGIRLLRPPDAGGKLAGFCWTKIHEPLRPGQSRLGEIYVIGVDPAYQGRGYGVAMTAAGLTWLHQQGLKEAMLYVEADNAAALATYEKLGFVHHRSDMAWVGTPT